MSIFCHNLKPHYDFLDSGSYIMEGMTALNDHIIYYEIIFLVVVVWIINIILIKKNSFILKDLYHGSLKKIFLFRDKEYLINYQNSIIKNLYYIFKFLLKTLFFKFYSFKYFFINKKKSKNLKKIYKKYLDITYIKFIIYIYFPLKYKLIKYINFIINFDFIYIYVYIYIPFKYYFKKYYLEFKKKYSFYFYLFFYILFIIIIYNLIKFIIFIIINELGIKDIYNHLILFIDIIGNFTVFDFDYFINWKKGFDFDFFKNWKKGFDFDYFKNWKKGMHIWCFDEDNYNFEKNNIEKNNIDKNNIEKNNIEKNNIEKEDIETYPLEKYPLNDNFNDNEDYKKYLSAGDIERNYVSSDNTDYIDDLSSMESNATSSRRFSNSNLSEYSTGALYNDNVHRIILFPEPTELEADEAEKLELLKKRWRSLNDKDGYLSDEEFILNNEKRRKLNNDEKDF